MSCAKVGCQKNAIKLHHVAKAPQEKKRKWEKLQSSRIKDGRQTTLAEQICINKVYFKNTLINIFSKYIQRKEKGKNYRAHE